MSTCFARWPTLHSTAACVGSIDGAAYQRLDIVEGALRATIGHVAPWSGHAARAIVAPTHVGVCRSDLRELSGTRPIRRDFGHEIVGHVVTAEPASLDWLVAAPAVC